MTLGLGLAISPSMMSSGSSGFAPLNQPLFVAAGDSITSNGGALSGTTANTIGRGYWVWAAQKLNARILPAYQCNAGVSGNQANQLVARYTTDVINKNPDVVFILIGTNDIVTGGRTSAAILADIDTMIAANRGIGAVTVLGKVLPRGSVASPMTGGQIATWEAVNAGIAARAAADLIVWDAESVVGNNDANHTIANGMTTSEDKLHPNTRGGQLIGDVVATAVTNAGILVDTDPLFTSDNAVGNIITSGFLTGTAGSKSGLFTGDVATGWTGTVASGGGCAALGAKVSRGALGDWQQVTISGTYTGSTRSVSVHRTISSGLNITAGNKIRFACDFEVDGAVALLGISSVNLTVTMNTSAYSATAMAAYAGETIGPTGPYSGVLMTQPFVAAANVTQLQAFIRISLIDTAGTDPVAGVFRFGRVEGRDLGA